jgi:hypothetical protein
MSVRVILTSVVRYHESHSDVSCQFHLPHIRVFNFNRRALNALRTPSSLNKHSDMADGSSNLTGVRSCSLCCCCVALSCIVLHRKVA